MTAKPLVVNGWQLFAHPLFLAQLNNLIKQVLALKESDPDNYTKKNATKRLAAIRKLILEVIPQDPSLSEYRQGKTLGDKHKHWFRAKLFQQYRLFFRYHASSKTIIYVWVNDENALRAYDSKNDAYKVFRKMLEGGQPPDNWEDLLAKAEPWTKNL